MYMYCIILLIGLFNPPGISCSNRVCFMHVHIYIHYQLNRPFGREGVGWVWWGAVFAITPLLKTCMQTADYLVFCLSEELRWGSYDHLREWHPPPPLFHEAPMGLLEHSLCKEIIDIFCEVLAQSFLKIKFGKLWLYDRSARWVLNQINRHSGEF